MHVFFYSDVIQKFFTRDECLNYFFYFPFAKLWGIYDELCIVFTTIKYCNFFLVTKAINLSPVYEVLNIMLLFKEEIELSSFEKQQYKKLIIRGN